MNKIQAKFISDALQYEDHLSEWEQQFINDIAEKSERPGFELTEKQNAILNRIANKVNQI